MGTVNPRTEIKTVLFVDIIDYTYLTSKLTPTSFNELHNHFDKLVGKSVKQFNGTIIKKIGDAFLILFDGATDAVKAGTFMQREFTEFNRSKVFHLPVNVRVAIHTGEVMHRKNDIYGDAVNTTSRIEKLAKKGQVVFSGSCYLELDKHEIAYTKIGRKKLRGVSKPLTLFRVRTHEELTLRHNLEQQQKHKTETTITYRDIMKQHCKVLQKIHHFPEFNIFSKGVESKTYDKCWLRDILYRHDRFRILNDHKTIEKTVNKILRSFVFEEYKIDNLLDDEKSLRIQSIVYGNNLPHEDHFWDEWNHKQHDSIGMLLYLVAKVEEDKKAFITKDIDYIRITNKLIRYLEKVKYWNGKAKEFWEENEEIHASSVGICVAGLKAISAVPKIKMPKGLIEKGRKAISKLVTKELRRKTFDASMLTLLEPELMVSKIQEEAILKRAENVINNEMTGITYKNDFYMFDNMEHQRDVKMDFLTCWIARIHEQRGDKTKAKRLIDRVLAKHEEKSAPESFFVNSKELSKEKRLGWNEALFIAYQHHLAKELIEVDR
ncbi:MAG: adenylate/guanylate cyclase domain-containing protein [Nanobdellota archaeon]